MRSRPDRMKRTGEVSSGRPGRDRALDRSCTCDLVFRRDLLCLLSYKGVWAADVGLEVGGCPDRGRPPSYPWKELNLLHRPYKGPALTGELHGPVPDGAKRGDAVCATISRPTTNIIYQTSGKRKPRRVASFRGHRDEPPVLRHLHLEALHRPLTSSPS